MLAPLATSLGVTVEPPPYLRESFGRAVGLDVANGFSR